MTDLNQNSVTPGTASPVTLLVDGAGGQSTTAKFLSVPGKAATLPDNIATTDMLSEMVSGTIALGPKDAACDGLHYNGGSSCLTAVLNSTKKPVYVDVFTPDYFQYILNTGKGSIKYGIATNVTHNQTIMFPKAFSSDQVAVIATSLDSGGNRLRLTQILSNAPNRNGFQLSLNYWNGSTFQNEKTPTTVFYIAIGQI